MNGTLSDGGSGVSPFTVLDPGVSRLNAINNCAIASDIVVGQNATLCITNDVLANRNIVLTGSGDGLTAVGTQTLSGNGDIVVEGINSGITTLDPSAHSSFTRSRSDQASRFAHRVARSRCGALM